jgi:hypothetical protein
MKTFAQLEEQEREEEFDAHGTSIGAAVEAAVVKQSGSGRKRTSGDL